MVCSRVTLPSELIEVLKTRMVSVDSAGLSLVTLYAMEFGVISKSYLSASTSFFNLMRMVGVYVVLFLSV